MQQIFQRELLSCKLEEVFSDSFSEELDKVIKEKRSWSALFNISLKGRDNALFSILLHISEHFIFVELEKKSSDSAGKELMHFEELITSLSSVKSADALFDTSVSYLKKVSGFGRVLLYQFDPNWNGGC